MNHLMENWQNKKKVKLITAWEQVIDYQLAVYGVCFGLGLWVH
jgi:hypothetical protein